jgi:hypothetical protein
LVIQLVILLGTERCVHAGEAARKDGIFSHDLGNLGRARTLSAETEKGALR